MALIQDILAGLVDYGSRLTIEGVNALPASDLGVVRMNITVTAQQVGQNISSLRCCKDSDTNLLNSLSLELHTRKRQRKEWQLAIASDTSPCEYIKSLKMCILDTIHGFYLKALTQLPYPAARTLIRSILLAGHCYGVMDPVSNIILNSVWYDVNFPALLHDSHIKEYDILNISSILRTEVCSLDGLVSLLKATHSISEHEALEYIAYRRCDISTMIIQMQNAESSHNPLAIAAKAGKHPQPSALGSFLGSLSHEKLCKLRSLLSISSALSCDAFEQIRSILKEESSTSVAVLCHPKLYHKCFNAELRRISAFDGLQRYLRKKIGSLLQIYAYQHPWEQRYELDFICGVQNTPRRSVTCYHINFMAVNVSSLEHMLFFAEFWEIADLSKPAFCCPLRNAYIGRCSECENVGSKIVHPDSGNYSMGNGTGPMSYNSCYAGAKWRVTKMVDILDTDLICFGIPKEITT